MRTSSLGTFEKVAPWLVIGYVVSEVAGLFKPDPEPQPGGDVAAAEGDTRPATLSEADADVIADGIEVAIWGAGSDVNITEDEEFVIRMMQAAQVTNDVLLLLNAYGDRGPLNELTLVETLHTYLSADDIAEINTDYAAKSITIRF